MSDLREKTPGEILTDASVAEFISAMGLSIAQAQTELDRNSIAQVGEYLKPQKGLEGKSLLQLGLSPPFYHYQHADLNVSLQLTMKVGETQAFGIGGSVKFGLDSGGKGAASGAARMAEVTLASLPASVTVDGKQTEAPAGANAGLDSAAETLADALRKPAGPFDRVFIGGARRTVKAALDPATATNPIITGGDAAGTAAAIAFLPTTESSVALLRISATPTTGQSETFTLAPNKSATVQSASDADAYAAAVVSAISGITGFRARLVRNAGGSDPNAPAAPGVIGIALFDTDDDRLKHPAIAELQGVANTLRGKQTRVGIDGYADTRGTVAYNQDLGERRARRVQEFLVRAGIEASRLTVRAPAPGETRWGATTGNPDNPQFRRVEVVLEGETARFILVESTGTTQIDDKPTPDLTGGGAGNGFVSVSKLAANPVASGTKIKLGDPATDVALSGAAVTTGGATLAADSPEAFAQNLTAAINAQSTAHKVRAVRRGAIVYLAHAEDAVVLDLLTTKSGAIALAAAGGARITKPLDAVASGGSGADQPDAAAGGGTKVSVAVGMSVDYRTSRMFETSVNGNSAISARLVAVPAPVEFLEEIRSYLPKPGPLPSPGPAD